jgi:hypothetical protein
MASKSNCNHVPCDAAVDRYNAAQHVSQMLISCVAYHGTAVLGDAQYCVHAPDNRSVGSATVIDEETASTV